MRDQICGVQGQACARGVGNRKDETRARDGAALSCARIGLSREHWGQAPRVYSRSQNERSYAKEEEILAAGIQPDLNEAWATSLRLFVDRPETGRAPSLPRMSPH